MSPRLPEQVALLAAQGVEVLTVVPVFLGQGGHVLRDLPLMLDELRAAYPELTIKTTGAVGEAPEVLRAMTDYCVSAAS
jgi:sirohydrochlorin cobaltochelatase